MKHLGPPPPGLRDMGIIHRSPHSPKHHDKEAFEFRGFRALDMKQLREDTDAKDAAEAEREKMQARQAARSGSTGTGALSSPKSKSHGLTTALAAGAGAILAAKATAARVNENSGTENPQQTGPDGPGTV